jgi:hypothetical protein
MGDTLDRQPGTTGLLIVVGIIVLGGLATVVGVVILCVGRFAQMAQSPWLAPLNWQACSSARGGFTVMLPGTPSENEQSMGTMLLSTSEIYFVMHGKREEFATLVEQIYGVDGKDFSRKPKTLDNLAAAFQPGQQGKTPVRLSPFRAEEKHPGLELEFRDERGLVRDRWIVTPTKVYYLRYVLPVLQSSEPPAGADQFFDSFRIKPQPFLWIL